MWVWTGPSPLQLLNGLAAYLEILLEGEDGGRMEGEDGGRMEGEDGELSVQAGHHR